MVELVLVADTVLHARLHGLENWLGQLNERRAEVERGAYWLLEVVVCAARKVFQTFSGHVDYWAQMLIHLHTF